MKIRLWQPFRADFVRRGHRKPERLTTRTPVDVEIATISASELPVVGRLVAGDARWSRVGAGDDGAEIERHGWNGNLYTPMQGRDGADLDVAAWSETITADERMLSQIEADPILLAHTARTGEFIPNWAKAYPPEELEGEFVADDRAQSIAAAEEWAKDLLLVDGKLWRRAPTPTWLVETSANGVYTLHLSSPSFVTDFYERNRVAGFRGDRLDDTVAWMEAFGRHRHRNPEICAASGSMLEFDPAYMRRDDLGIETAHAGRTVLGSVCNQISSLSTSGVGHYAAARDIHDIIASGQGDAANVVAFLGEVDALVEDLRRFDFPTHAYGSRDNILKDIDLLEWRIRRGEAPALADGLTEAAPDLERIGPRP